MQNLESENGIPSSSSPGSQEGVTPIVIDASESVAVHELVLLKTKDEKPPNIQPWLPLELWRYIFTCIAGRPKIAWSHFSRSPETSSRCPWTRTACTLVLVCRSWHAMAIDLLYGDVALTSLLHACLLHLTLSSSLQNYGRLVKRIVISTISVYADTDGVFFDCMTGIVSHCPRLQSITMGRNHFKPIHNWEDIASNVALNITELHLDDHNHKCHDWGLTLSSRDLVAISSFSNLESLTIPWSMKGIHEHDITIPHLRDLTLCIVSNSSQGLGPLSLPSLQNLTFSLQYRQTTRIRRYPVTEDGLHRIFTAVLAVYGPQLRRLHLNPVDWDEGWGDVVVNNQLLLDHCPSLEHFITYTTKSVARAPHHPTLRWIDMWVPVEWINKSGSGTAHGPAATCVQDATNFPALQGCRFLDLALSPIADLPVLLSPGDPLPRDGPVQWTMPPFRISQTRERVTWADPYEYHSDSDSSYYAPSSSEDEEAAEFSDDDDSSPDDFGPESFYDSSSSDDSDSESSEFDADPRFDVYRLADGALYASTDQ